MRKFKSIPIIVSAMLVLQLFFPIIGALAAVVQAPANLKIYERYPGNAVIEWDAVSNSSAYKVYRLDGDTKTLATQVTTNKAFISLKEGTYTYAVTAVVSGQESPLSQPVSINIVYPEMQAPGNVKASVEKFYNATLSWDSASYVHYYKIYQVIDGVRKLVTTTEMTTQTFNTLPEGHYVYEITSYNSIFGESAQAAHVEFDIVYPEMEAPAGLTYSVANGNDVTLSWTRANYANKYNIYEIVDNKKTLVTSTTNVNVMLSNVSAGTHRYEVTSYSTTFKESQNAAAIEFNLIHPVVQTPGNVKFSITNGNDGTLSWGKVEYAVSYKVYQIINGSKVLLKQTPYQQVSFPNMDKGTYIYEVTAYSDRFGESAPARLEQEVVHPAMQKPDAFTASILNVNTIYLKWKTAEYATTYKLYQIVDGERKFISDINNTYTAINNLPEGNYVYEITSYSDRFGESAEASRVEAAIVYPKILAPNVQVYVNQEVKSIALWWDAVDYAASYDIYQIIDGQRTLIQNTPNNRIVFNNMPYGAYIYDVVARSKFGDSTPSEQVTANVEPILEAPTTPEASVEGDDVILSWNPVKDADSYNVYEEVDGERVLVGNTNDPEFTISDLEPGEHTYVIVPVSPSGQESDNAATITVDAGEKDTTAPVTESNVEDKWYQGEAAVELTATDDLSGVDKTYYSVNGSDFEEGTAFAVNEGVNEVSFYSVDKAGNKEEVKTVKVKIDTMVPETTSNVSDKWYQSKVSVELEATDDLSGVDKTYYSVNGSDLEEGTSFTVKDEGVNEIAFYSVDKAGNVEETKTVQVKIDWTAPETVSNVTNEWHSGEVAVELTATDNLSGVDKTYYSVNGSEFKEGTAFTVKDEGVNEVSFYSVDKAGNKEEVKTVKVKIDTAAPETKSNVSDKWNQGEAAVELTATDDLSGVAQTFYSVNGSDFVEGTSFTVNEEGENEVTFFSVDNAGNVEEIKTVKVKIDTTAPETVSNVADKWYQSEVSVELKATDDLSGADKTYYSINGSEFTEGTAFTVKDEGINEVSFYSIDKAGNIEKAKTVALKLDKTAPTVSFPLAKEQELGSMITLDYTANDNLSGIAVEKVTLNGKTYQKGDKITLDQPGTNKLLVTVTDAAGWTTQVEKEFVVYIPVTLEVLPKVIKGNNGVFTVKASIPKEYQSASFDVSIVTLNGVAADPKNNGLQKQAEKGHFKFERADFDWKKGETVLELRGYLDNGYLVIAKTIVEVK
ncbi:fibronectin type III domain-containing protein [Neobacillus kokaensis]|uniref:Fibronectin type-III domain-containing protein n=1 Tax=Neobacillus kokaensis TaxID=2759023 RepID=A0ABQ3N7H2_9BACI|nr:fibronectin type III domain-containing protein [Neobacillus kokaensis]GHH99991.1 hypothetical protein AM1BK_35340 [Neobacillus kokaensis]